MSKKKLINSGILITILILPLLYFESLNSYFENFAGDYGSRIAIKRLDFNLYIPEYLPEGYVFTYDIVNTPFRHSNQPDEYSVRYDNNSTNKSIIILQSAEYTEYYSPDKLIKIAEDVYSNNIYNQHVYTFIEGTHISLSLPNSTNEEVLNIIDSLRLKTARQIFNIGKDNPHAF